jgi:hypothetical protein
MQGGVLRALILSPVDHLGRLLATTASRALMAATDGLIAVWATQLPDADLVAMTAIVMDQVGGLWPDACRAAPPGRQWQ